MKIIENGKKREIKINRAYTYVESISNEDEDYDEFLTLLKGDDYSFLYQNYTFKNKESKFVIESDSIFYDSFSKLTEYKNPLVIKDDYSDRSIEFRSNNGNIEINFHLLEGEIEGTVELKNIMTDIRSRADSEDENLKPTLSKFFDSLVELEKKSPELKLTQNK